MSFIYSFLQKRKMHESHHGIFMVFIAYALSALLLILGSDMFYNIKSSAADTKANTLEETKDMNPVQSEDRNAAEIQTEGLQTADNQTADNRTTDNQTAEIQGEGLQATQLYAGVIPTPGINSTLLNPYNLPEGAAETSIETEGKDTIWLLGNAMDNNAYEALMKQMEDYYGAAGIKAADDKTSTGKMTTDKTTTSKTTTAKAASGKKDSSKTASKKSDSSTVKSFSVEVASGKIITITEEEVTMLQRIVQAEAGGEDMVGKILVANVIFNRIVNKQFPDSVESVIFQKSDGDYQFSPVKSGRYWKVKISSGTKEAVERALDGEDYSKGALYFIAKKQSESANVQWFENNLTKLFKHGGHEFYK